MSLSAPNPEAVAAERLQGGGDDSPPLPGRRGPKKGAKYKPRSTGSSPAPVAASEARSPEEQAETEKMLGGAAGAIWNLLVAPTMKRRTLTDGESQALGKAIDPVLQKYLPDMGGYGPEIGLVVTVGALWIATAPPKGEPNTGAELEFQPAGGVFGNGPITPDDRTSVR